MKAAGNLKLGILGLVTLTILSGCGGPKNDPKAQEELQKAMVNSYNVKSGSYSMKLSGQVTADKNAKAEAEFKELNGSIDLSGVVDVRTSGDTKFTLKIDGKGSVNGEKEQSVGGELRVAEKNAYFSLNKLEVDSMPDLYKAAVAAFLNKWWYIALPADAIKGFNAAAIDEKDMTPEQKQLKELVEKTKFFKNVTDMGEDKVGSLVATKYSVELDKEAFNSYLAEVSKISGQSRDLGDFNKFMKSVEFKGSAWVSKEDKMFRKLEGKATIAPSEETANASMKFQIGFLQDDLEKDVKVEVPAGAELFDLGKILGVTEEATK